MLLLQTVATASERLGSAVLKRPGHVIQFIGSMLQDADAEAAHLAVALLVMILSGQVRWHATCKLCDLFYIRRRCCAQVQIPRSDWGLLDGLMPILDTLSQDPESPYSQAAQHCRRESCS